MATRHDNLRLTEQEENFHRPSSLLIDIQRLSRPSIREEIRGLLKASCLFSAKRFSILAQNWGAQPVVEKLYEMNVRPTLMEAALLQRMRFWRLRALHGPAGKLFKI